MLRFNSVVPCRDGYAWETLDGRPVKSCDGRDPKRLILRPRDATFSKHYDPFVTEPALYRIFAELAPTPEEIQGFANRYGDISPLDDVMRRGGSSLSRWQHEIGRFRELVEAADRLLASLASQRTRSKRVQDIAAFIEPLLITVPVFLAVAIKGDAIDVSGTVYELTNVFSMQLVEALIERKSYHSCDYCGKPFELTPQVNRSDRVFCSDNCRVKAYQRRRKQAIAMRTEGKSLRDIAKALDSKLPTVKKWVGEAKKED